VGLAVDGFDIGLFMVGFAASLVAFLTVSFELAGFVEGEVVAGLVEGLPVAGRVAG
jgi:hypothetical protein